MYMYGTLRSISCVLQMIHSEHMYPICSVQECVEFMHSLACQLNVSYTCILHIYMLVHVQCVYVLSMA